MLWMSKAETRKGIVRKIQLRKATGSGMVFIHENWDISLTRTSKKGSHLPKQKEIRFLLVLKTTAISYKTRQELTYITKILDCTLAYLWL